MASKWTLIYDICRRDALDLQPVVLSPAGVPTLEEAQALVKQLHAADVLIGAAKRNYSIFPLVKHIDYDISDSDDDDIQDVTELRGPNGNSEPGACN